MHTCGVVVAIAVVAVALAPAKAIPQQRFGGHGGLLGGLTAGLAGAAHQTAGLISAVSPVIPSPVAPPSTCRHWCRTPENSVYCCKENDEIQGNPYVVKQGQCPLVRAQCPTYPRGYQPPAPCSSDGDCGGYDKCCFDRCLERHICKYPDVFGR